MFTLYHSTPSRPRFRKLWTQYPQVEHGAMWTLEKLTPMAGPWALDNGAYNAYNNDTEWDREEWLRVLDRACRIIESEWMLPPRFAILPDKVECPEETFERSENHVEYIPDGWDMYFSVQDGMSVERACDFAEDIGCSGIFIGGSIDWKHKVMRRFKEECDRRGLKCHVGRPSGGRGLEMAYRIGVDSVDTGDILLNEAFHYIERLGSTNSLL